MLRNILEDKTGSRNYLFLQFPAESGSLAEAGQKFWSSPGPGSARDSMDNGSDDQESMEWEGRGHATEYGGKGGGRRNSYLIPAAPTGRSDNGVWLCYCIPSKSSPAFLTIKDSIEPSFSLSIYIYIFLTCRFQNVFNEAVVWWSKLIPAVFQLVLSYLKQDETAVWMIHNNILYYSLRLYLWIHRC